MSLGIPRAFGPGVREVLGDDACSEIGRDGGVALLRPAREGRSLLVLHQRPPDVAAVLAEADRLSWLAGRGPAPEVVASGRADEGDEAVVVRLDAGSSAATEGHPMGPEALVAALAPALRELHELDIGRCPFDAGMAQLRTEVADRLARGLITPVEEGAYADRSAESLVDIFDELIAPLGALDDGAMIHGAIASERLWFDPSGGITLTGWRRAGVGDRHLDLAATAVMLTQLYGPALVGPFFDAYGLDGVDLRRLDACQLLAHLLS